MFSLTVRDHMMVAHSLRDPFFGPAQALHGATYVVEATVRREGLDEHGVVADIGALSGHLHAVLADLTYGNLDEHPAFAQRMSTTEVLAQHVAEQLAAALPDRTRSHLHSIDVVLREHPDAWAGYSLSVRSGPQ